MTRPELIELAARIAVLWPSWRGPATEDDGDVLVTEWQAMLGDLDVRMVTAVMRSYAAEAHEFAPSPGILRARAIAASAPRGLDVDQAWGELLDAIARHGYTGQPIWTSPVLADVVRSLGGWVHICQTWMVDDEMANRAHFRRFYEAAAARHASDATPPDDARVLDRYAELAARAVKHAPVLEPGVDVIELQR